MNKLNRMISLLLCAVILVGLLPTGVWAVDNITLGNQSIVVDDTTTTVKVWRKVDSISAGGTYLIVNSNTAGEGHLLTNNGGTVADTTVVISGDTNGAYILNSDVEANVSWVVSSESSGYKFTNNGGILSYDGSVFQGFDLALSDTGKTFAVESETYLYFKGTFIIEYTRYVVYDGDWVVSDSKSGVYFYASSDEGVEETTYGYTYEVAGTDLSGISAIQGDEVDLTSTLTYTSNKDNSTENQSSTYPVEYTVVSGGEILSIPEGSSTATLTGTAGTAVVRATYTVDGQTAWDEFTVTATAPQYSFSIKNSEGNPLGDPVTAKTGTTLDVSGTSITYVDSSGATQTVSNTDIEWSISDTSLAEIQADGTLSVVGTSGTFVLTATATAPDGEVLTDTLTVDIIDAVYTLDLQQAVLDADGNKTYDENNNVITETITKPIMIKEVEKGDTYPLWAVIYKDGENMGTLDDAEFAKLTFVSSDTSIATVDAETGIATFTGTEGLVTITASYEYTTGKAVTDSVVFSVSTGSYIVPGDGTDDFPAYPNQGSVRMDKTTTPVGSFNQTGTTMVELSMTGVPVTTDNAMDVVVMLDMTGSMSTNGMTAAEEATKAFVKMIVQNEDGTYNDNRVAVYAFNSGDSSPYELVSLKKISSDAELTTANTAIDTASDKQASGGTPFDEAAKQCYDVLQAAKKDGVGNDRQQFCVFMSDGGPTTYYGSDGKTYYGGNNNSGDVELTECMTGYSSSTSSDWSFTLPTEYYTDQMKADGVTVYTVGLLLQTAPSNPAPYSSMTDSTYDSTTDSLTTIGSHYYFTSSILKQMATDESKYIDIFNVDNADNATAKFQAIAQSILEAAKDVVVTDKMGSHFTMVFEPPNTTVGDAVGDQEFYIEVVEYALNPVTDSDGNIIDYTRGIATSKLKLYMGTTDNTYYAATAAGSTNDSNKFAAPVFDTVAVGTKYYWTQTEAKGDCGISVVGADGNTYYFVSTGDGTHSMTSGAYAYGTLTKETIIEVDENGNQTNGDTNTVCDDLIIATPYFAYNASTKILVWTMDKVSSSEMALRYFLYLDKSAGWEEAAQKMEAGTYSTNEYADFTYTNFQDNQVQQDFPAPQVTWNGAQVSYVFYLVNDKGQPVNRTGRVVPFSEAVYVTDVYTQSVLWNSDELTTSLDANLVAGNLLPSVYELYDSNAAYTIHVFETENDSGSNNYFKLEGTSNSTYVFNTKADAKKYTAEGIYTANKTGNDEIDSVTIKCKEYTEDGEYEDEIGKYNLVDVTVDSDHFVADGFDFANTTVAFAVVWKPQLVEDTVVIDYGLEVSIDVTSNDLSTGKAIGLRTDEPTDVEKNKGTTDLIDCDTEIKVTLSNGLEIGTATISGNNVAVALNEDNGMLLTEPIKFYYVYEVQYYQGENLVTKYMYSSVTVIPATTVYYEENFIQFDAAGTKITYTTTDENGVETEHTSTSTGWESVGAVTGTWQDTDRPGVDILAGMDANNLYGYDSHYLNCNTYSNGAAKKVTVDANTFATATFTFCGTGFDLIGVTSNATGTVIAEIKNEAGTVVKTIFVDTYYGYTKVSTQMVDDDGVALVDENGDPVNVEAETWGTLADMGELYQVPIITARELTYGKYTVTTTVSYNEQYDHNKDGSNEFYLDAVRIYDPTGVVSGTDNDVVENAYQADNEWSPSFEEIRNVLLTFYGSGSMADGATLQNSIDGNSVNTSIEDYENYGPNNELYLGKEQKLVIDVDDTFVNNQNVADIQIGLKSANDKDLTVKIYNLVDGNESNVEVIDINTASDLFYSILDRYTGTVVIENASADDSAVLSITNIKSTQRYTVTQSISYDDSSSNTEQLLDNTNSEQPSVVWTALAKFYIDIVIAVAGAFSDIETVLIAIYAAASAVI